jgi:hypothetical protein
MISYFNYNTDCNQIFGISFEDFADLAEIIAPIKSDMNRVYRSRSKLNPGSARQNEKCLFFMVRNGNSATISRPGLGVARRASHITSSRGTIALMRQ